MIVSLLLAPMEKALNKALKTDPESLNRLKDIAGTRFKVVLTDINLTLIFEATDTAINIYKEDECVSHVTVKGSSLAFLQSFLAGNNAASAKKFSLHIEGNTHTAQSWQQLFSHMDIDWQALLEPVIGEQPAYHGIKAFGFLKKQIIKTKNKIMQDGAEYLKHEKKVLVPEHLAKHFSREVTDVSQAVDRLEARIQRLEKLHA